MVTRENDGDWRPTGGDGSENRDRADGKPEPRHNAKKRPDSRLARAEKADPLDVIESVLRSLKTDLMSADEGAAGPANYDQDREPFDDRPGSEAEHDEAITVQSMARKLAPRRGGADREYGYHDAAKNAHGPAGSGRPDSVAEGGAGAEGGRWPSRKNRRRRRLSRTQGRLHAPNADRNRALQMQRTAPELPRAIVRSGRNVTIGAGLGVLLVAGTTAAFGFIEPLNGLLPERVAAVLDLVSRGNTGPANQSDNGKAGQAVAPARPEIVKVDPSMAASTAGLTEATDAQALRIGAIMHPNGNGRGAGAVAATGQASAAIDDLIRQARTLGAGAAFEFDDIGSYGAAESEMSSDTISGMMMRHNPPAGDESEPEAFSPGETAFTEADPAVQSSGADELLVRGHKLLESGDIGTARLFFRRAVAMGDSRGAKGLGMTYDRKTLQQLPVAGLKPDDEQAGIWYRRSAEMIEDKRLSGVAAVNTVPELKN